MPFYSAELAIYETALENVMLTLEATDTFTSPDRRAALPSVSFQWPLMMLLSESRPGMMLF